MKYIKAFLWFLKESPSFTGKSLLWLILHDKFIKRAIWFSRDVVGFEKLSKKYGGDMAYAMTNRVIEFDCED